MIFGCDRCGRRYSVPDERVQGRAFRVTCKSCGNVIVVRPAAAAAPAPAAPPAGGGAPDLQDPFAAAAPGPSASAPPARPASPPRPASAARAPQAAPRAAAPAPGPGAAATRGDGSPPAAARPPPGPTAATSRSGGDTSRSLTTAEMAWMSAEQSRAAAPAAEPEPEVAVTEPAQVAAGRAAERTGPGILRIVLAAVVLGLAAAAVVAFVVRPAFRSKPRPPPRAVIATPSPAPAVPPPPAATPEPPMAASPQPASATLPPDPPAPPPSPSAAPAARFEPGTVKIARVRRAEKHRLAGKDRRLLDLLARKHDEAAPPEPIEKLDLDTARSLDPAAVERVVEESQGAFSGCVTRAAKVSGLPDARRATLLLTVAGSGEVSTAWVAEADVSRTRLGKCLVGAARRLVFPAFEGDPVDVSVPLTLEAR